MRTTFPFTLLASALGALAQKGNSGSVSVTPHEQYSSSIGVLGCLVNTNRIAYWPASVDCNNICVKLSYDDREEYLLRVDQSQGAYDISYDAWNKLYTGKSATDAPESGGGVTMEFENVDAKHCKGLIRTKDKRLPLSASNSMNFLASCLEQPDSWVANNYQLYNVLDPLCSLGVEQECSLDWPTANQADCPSALGVPTEMEAEHPVVNVAYGTGETYLAVSGQAGDLDEESGAASVSRCRMRRGISLALPAAGKAVSAGERRLYIPFSLLLPVAMFLWMG